MAMNKKPKPIVPDKSGTKAEVRGRMSTKPTVKVKPKAPLTKGAVRNPSAPTAAGPRGGGVRVMTQSETGMKTGRAGRNRSGVPMNKTYKPGSLSDSIASKRQAIAGGLRPGDARAINPKNDKSKGVTPPKKKTPPTPPKRRPGLRPGGFGGSGGLFGTKNK